MTKQDLLTVEFLRLILDYDPVTGVFWWKNCTGYNKRNRNGTRAGVRKEKGYIKIQINGWRYYAHRLAWFWMTGIWPTRLDHKDGDQSNNVWTNLRLADQSQNSANQKAKARELPKGVFEAKNRRRPYQAYITVRYRRFFLGSFSTAEEAHAAYFAAAQVHFGEFARAA